MSRTTPEKFRLVTRSDFDGLACAVLMQKLDLIDDLLFAQPKDVQDGLIQITARDILTNLPYSPLAHMVFDHHSSEALRVGGTPGDLSLQNLVLRPDAPSAARVVYEHFGGAAAFPTITEEFIAAVDKADTASFDRDDIVNPQGWTLLNFLMDPRTGLGRFKEFRISNYQLMMRLVDFCARHTSVDDILAMPDVQERIDVLRQQKLPFTAQLKRVAHLHDDVVVVDLRGEQTIHAGNRFLVYALFPEAANSIHVMPGREGRNTVLAVGRSILNPSSSTDIGALMLTLGGGGHAAAGSTQVANEDADEVLGRIIGALRGLPLAV